jgi:hypothetical protein
MEPRSDTSDNRTAAGRRRARAAKAVLAATAVAVFGAGVLLTRSTASGHVKHQAQALAAPGGFVRSVRRNALQAGQIAPPQAPPPQASTSQS